MTRFSWCLTYTARCWEGSHWQKRAARLPSQGLLQSLWCWNHSLLSHSSCHRPCPFSLFQWLTSPSSSQPPLKAFSKKWTEVPITHADFMKPCAFGTISLFTFSSFAWYLHGIVDIFNKSETQCHEWGQAPASHRLGVWGEIHFVSVGFTGQYFQCLLSAPVTHLWGLRYSGSKDLTSITIDQVLNQCTPRYFWILARTNKLFCT